MIWNRGFWVNRRDFLKHLTAGAIGGRALMNQTVFAECATSPPVINEIDPNAAHRSVSELDG